MNYSTLLTVVALIGAAAVVWICLAAKMVADDEEAKAQAEGERREQSRKREAARRERELVARGPRRGTS